MSLRRPFNRQPRSLRLLLLLLSPFLCLSQSLYQHILLRPRSSHLSIPPVFCAMDFLAQLPIPSQHHLICPRTIELPETLIG
jgi:hypothetical protein